MKNSLLSLFSLLFVLTAWTQTDPVIMEVAGEKVTKSEFLQIYLKNNNDPQYDKQSLDEYMELFTKFKLKVTQAEALGYDTISKLQKELAGYRKQLATPYLTDSSMNEYLVKEAYERTVSERRAAHILIRIDETASPKDTLKAYSRILGLRKRIEAGEDFEKVAKGPNGSEDPSVTSNGGDLGYFTAFQMVTDFEDAAFNTPIGGLSMPIRTKFGYHIIKVTDSRKARGSMNAAHIMIAANSKTSTSEEMESAEKKIAEIYEKLENGGDFESLAKKFSDDPSTANRGGVLPPFGTGMSTRMVFNFEEAAFALKNEGDFSKPVQTEYGFHIIKRISLRPVDSYDAMKKDLQVRVNRDDRSKRTQDSFVAKLKDQYDYKSKGSKSMKWFYANVDSAAYYKGEWTASKLKRNKVIFCMDDVKVCQKDFVKYIEENWRGNRRTDVLGLVNNQYKKFEKNYVLDYEDSKLEEKHPEFKALMKEYHDGILLYEVMSDRVWNKAMKDTTGLKVYFEKNREKYKWGERYDATIYECLNQNIANEVFAMLQKDSITSKEVIEKINADSELNLKVRMNKFEINDTPFLKDQKLKKGINKSYAFDGKFYVVKLDEKLAISNKELKEVKGAVTSDYQNYLEKEWLAELAKKHSVKVNKEVLYSLDK
jgi:peptidyl-prolyl cis-trans isomerase SurA